ncbi:hypothetical protein Tsubulata_022431 [Turnera subulata]|uniref:Thiaminase-2/PQQC domain-containing protein n=1 Tax=Turnera subulata TaxID=218843 RepID=A0A9Q0FN88_9ROSI|nr:hypothetical protein Tsubulata_022431 [Turnera subulata]
MEEKVKGGAEKDGMIDRWVKKHTLLYTGATRHPFILNIREGTTDFSSFKTWLGQDYVFVREFVPFVASVLIKVSKVSDNGNDMEVILGGVAFLNDEIAWFKQEASKWAVPLTNLIVHNTNKNYCRFLESIMSTEVDYAVASTVLWAIEAVYQESFAHCLEDGNQTPQLNALRTVSTPLLPKPLITPRDFF